MATALCETPLPRAVAAGRGTRVLLVEDDLVSLRILKKRVAADGYLVETAEDGLEASEKLESFRPHLIISDWMMPRMDGRELCQVVKHNPATASTYFILLTARDKHEDVVQALDTGADEYIVKPCNGPELMARLRAAERLLHLQSELALSNRQLTLANDRINKELQDIGKIQRALLPQNLPKADGWHFAAHYRPSTECSGDFYDLLVLGEGRIGVVMGDVSGHGAAAMVAMALIRTLYKRAARETIDPAECLSLINRWMFEYLPTEQYATMFYGILDTATGRLDFSSGGHPPPLHCGDGLPRGLFLEGCEGFPIKLVDPSVPYENRTLQLAPGRRLFLYTDGVNETFNEAGAMYGMDRLCEAMSARACDPLEDMLAGLLDDLEGFRGTRPLCDDLSLLIIGREQGAGH